jgi:hypothetical protein
MAARVALETGNPQQADEDLGTFVRRYRDHPRRLEAQLLRGRAEAQRENWASARTYFQQVLDAEAQADLAARARAGRTEAEYRLNRLTLDRAVDKLTNIARGLPYSRAAHEARLTAARLLADQDRNGDALEQLGRILRQGAAVDRRRVQSLVNRLLPEEMDKALGEDQPFRAFSLYARFSGPKPAGHTARRAFRALLDLGAYRSARKFLADFAERQGPTIEESRWEWELARAYERAGPPEEGLIWVDEVLGGAPDHPFSSELLLAKARLLNRGGRFGEALALLDRHPDLPATEAAWLRSRALKGSGELEAAYRVLDRHFRTRPTGEIPPVRLAAAGDLAARVGRVYSARDYWQRALDGDLPDWSRSQVRALLGVDAAQRADFEAAREHLEAVGEDGAVGRVAQGYLSLIPLMREQLL